MNHTSSRTHRTHTHINPMSDLTEVERRKLLRERRQKKFANGGASTRLNRITGQVDNSFLPTDSPLESGQSTPSTPETNTPGNNEQSTKQMDELLASISAPSSAKKTATPSPANTTPPKNPQLALFEQLMKVQKNQDSGVSDDSTANLLSAFLQSAQRQPGVDTDLPSTPQQQKTPDNTMVSYHEYKVNRLKAWNILVKWVFFLLPYLFYVTHPTVVPTSYSTFNYLLDRSNFFTVFTTFEIIAISIYYQLLLSMEKQHNVTTLQRGGKIMSMISMVPEGILPISNLRGKVTLLLQYWDVLSIYLTDICFALVFIGILKYYHS